jgi:hypothetical protein
MQPPFKNGGFLLTVIARCETLVETTTTILHSFRFLARVFVVGSLVIVFSVVGSLRGELAGAWVAKIRRIVKHDAAENKSC